MLAEAETGAALPIELTAAFAIALAIAALLGRRRMPAGLAEGTLVAAVSGSAILLLAVDSAGDFVRPALGHVLTGLTLVWYALSRIAAPRPAWGLPTHQSPELADSSSQGSLYDRAGFGGAVGEGEAPAEPGSAGASPSHSQTRRLIAHGYVDGYSGSGARVGLVHGGRAAHFVKNVGRVPAGKLELGVLGVDHVGAKADPDPQAAEDRERVPVV